MMDQMKMDSCCVTVLERIRKQKYVIYNINMYRIGKKKVITVLSFLMILVVGVSCQKELPDAIKDAVASKGGQGQTPTPTPTPENPTQQGDIPAEGDNPWPNY